jgi:tripartite-type tricarboxylate transporter receptor subunit TctC
MDRRKFIGWAGAAAATPLWPGIAAYAQSKYPERPIRLVVPYAPGGVVDAVARNWAERMHTPLGTIVVENQGGGGGTIGANAIAHATPDGYSLLFGDTSCEIIAPYLMLHPLYDATKDFTPISLIATSSTSIVIHPSVPAKNFAEFIAYAKANQAKLSYGSAGTGTVTHLAGELFKQLTNTPKITHVPYRGAGPGLIDLVGGVLPMMTPNVTSQVLGFHRAGKLRILAVCAPARLKAAPEIPAAVETLPGMVAQLTSAVFGPAGTPQPVVEKISTVTANVLKDPDFNRILGAAGLEAQSDASPAAARKFFAAEREHLLPIIKAAGLKPQ